MKSPRIVMIVFALTLALAPQLRTSAAEPEQKIGVYSARLISPRAGEVLLPGQVVKITWEATFPKLDLSWCETEILLSIDGGRTFTLVTGERDPREKSVEWIVPNTPSETAVLNLHFGCLGRYPETESIQTQSTFVIGQKPPQ
jgi:hypothetical protein